MMGRFFNWLGRLGPLQLALLVAVSIFLIRLPGWIAANFGVVSWEQISFHLQAETAGVPFRLIRSLIRELILKPLGFLAFVWVALHLLSRKAGRNGLYKAAAASLTAFFAWGLVWGMVQTAKVSRLDEVFASMGDKKIGKDYDWMADMYSAVDAKSFARSKSSLNLVWVYVESLEEDKVSPARHPYLYRTRVNATEFQNLPGTGWTIAGIVSSQCGLPLMPFGLFGGNSFGETTEFLPRVTCLGDVLASSGYENTFLGGADPKFAGKYKFLRDHGFGQIIGKDHIRARIKEDPPEGSWGFPDDVVFKVATEDIRALHRSGKPFFYNILTLDTHGPHGRLSDYCKEKGHNKEIPSIFDCVVSQVEKFVAGLESEQILKDTVVVISGDHPFMGARKISFNPFKDESGPERKVFLSIIHPEKQLAPFSTINHFDLYPTVLSSIGFTVKNGRAGLGRDLYAESVPDVAHSAQEFANLLRRPSKKYLDAWGHEVSDH